MSKIVLYHGTPNKEVIPAFGLGDEKHDYGKGFEFKTSGYYKKSRERRV